MSPDVSIYMAFLAGLISFLSPCVLPLVPGYVSFVSGVSIKELQEQEGVTSLSPKGRRGVLINSLCFVGGFSIVFILLGATATWLGSFLTSHMSLLTKIGGLVIIFFGLFKLGLIRSLFFNRETRFHLKTRKFGFIGAILIGTSFAFGWTPCIGPILGAILVYAGTLGNVSTGIALLSIYSIGLGIPFLVTAFAINKFFKFFDRIKKHLGLIDKITGVIMVLLGLMIFFNKLILIQSYVPFLNRFAF